VFCLERSVFGITGIEQGVLLHILAEVNNICHNFRNRKSEIHVSGNIFDTFQNTSSGSRRLRMDKKVAR
jgi:hypothetical protein